MKTTEEQDQEYLEEQREQLRKDVEARISKHVQGKAAVDCNVDPPDVHWKINDLQVQLSQLSACVDRLGRRQTELEQALAGRVAVGARLDSLEQTVSRLDQWMHRLEADNRNTLDQLCEAVRMLNNAEGRS